MKYAFALAAVAGLAAASAHVGHEHLHRRDATVTDWTVVTVTDVVTVYGPSPVAEETSAAAVVPSSAPVEPSSAPAAAPSSAPVISSAAAVSVSAAQPTTLATAVVPGGQGAASSTPAKISTPAAVSTSAAAPSSAAAAAPSGGASSGAGNYGMQTGASIAANCPENAPCKADMTTYTPGMGSCGYDDSGSDDAVALQIEMFGSVTNSGVNSPTNKLCNKKIFIKNPATGETATGVIRDACPGCTHPQSATSGGIDLALPLFKKVNAGSETGRNPVEWYFLD